VVVPGLPSTPGRVLLLVVLEVAQEAAAGELGGEITIELIAGFAMKTRIRG
jgi:hypothetical protein